MKEEISQKVIEDFLNGEDSEQYIVGIEYDYKNNTIYKIIQDPEKGKIIKQDTIIPFLWVGDLTGFNFYQNSKSLQKKKMTEYGITIEPLNTYDDPRLNSGLRYLVKCMKGYSELLSFFKQGGIDPWGEKYKKYFQILNPAEQYLVQKRKRLFKGIDEYEDVNRLVFDIETTGLNPETDRIIMIGIKNNRGLQHSIDAFGENGEQRCITEFFNLIKELKPTIIGGYNSASFDFPFIMKRAEILKMDIVKLTQIMSLIGIKLKEGILKLANEVEPYNQYVIWGFNIIDISHSVRRAQAINSEIKSWGLKYVTKYLEKEKPNRIYVDGAHISKIYLGVDSYYVNPKSGGWKKIGDPGTEGLLEKYPGKYEIWPGRKLIEQYLDDDLYETMIVDDSFSQATFLLSKLVPTTYERIATMGTATLWKLIMLAWSYQNNLAIPEKDEKRDFVGGLSRLLRVGYSKGIVKFDFGSLYPSIDIVYDIFPDCDVLGALKAKLKYFRNIRIGYKRQKEQYEKINPELSEKYDRKQLPLKIFINAFFGSLSAPKVFHWGDMNLGEMTTCIGRQFLRMMIMHYTKRGYVPLTMDTDGICFSMPEDIDAYTYIGKGLNELVEKDKEYIGIYADTAEFNDIFMRNEMGLDVDFTAISMINISKKNYILKMMKKGKIKIKLTGNTIKSKKLAQYVVEFLDEGFKYLLDGDGLSFINLYYDYIDKLYNHKIPLVKMANKSRVKQSVEDYKKYIKKKNKGGSLMSRQAHMELILQDGYPASLGETIYYINNGTKKSDGDVQKVTKYVDKWTKKQLVEYQDTHDGKLPPKESHIEINCYRISEEDILNNPNMTGDYNVSRYITNFNKRIMPLLVVFKPEIRDDILIENPENRQYFTTLQCELDSGHPLKPEGQGTLEEVMTLSDKEVIFWNRVEKDPYFMYVDDSLSLVDQYWVDHNKKVVRLEAESSKIIEEDELISNDGRDLAYHSTEV
jgi:DNA polymerase elongation subunit (family B)